MKQVTTLLIATLVTLTSFATGTPSPKSVINAGTIKAAIKSENTLSVSLKATGKVNLSWNAAFESTTTSYQIQKSVNGSAFKTVAVLMGETNETYSFRDSVKGITGNVEYKVILVDNNTVVKTLTQGVVIL
jgi:hypothetical protein